MNKNIAIFLISSLTLLSCEDKNESTTSDSSIPNSFFSDKTESFWVNEVESDNVNKQDSIFILGEVSINSKTYKKIDSETVPVGISSNFLNNKAIRIDGSRLLVNGKTNFDIIPDLPIEIDLKDFVLHKENANTGEVLSLVKGQFEKTFEGYPFKFEYSLSATAMNSLSVFTDSKGKTYNNVKPVKVSLVFNIYTNTTISDIPVKIEILKSQEIVNSKLYFAKNIGIVYTESQIQYKLQDFSQFNIQFPFPTSLSKIQKEYLKKYKY